jgi:hypothetical protein
VLPVLPRSRRSGRRRARPVHQPDDGIWEGPATGSAAGPLVSRLVAQGVVRDGATVFVERRHARGRPSPDPGPGQRPAGPNRLGERRRSGRHAHDLSAFHTAASLHHDRRRRPTTEADERHLHRASEPAAAAPAAGDMSYGSRLVGPAGDVLAEDRNTADSTLPLRQGEAGVCARSVRTVGCGPGRACRGRQTRRPLVGQWATCDCSQPKSDRDAVTRRGSCRGGSASACRGGRVATALGRRCHPGADPRVNALGAKGIKPR